MMTLITINRVYYLIGFVVMLLVVMTLRDRANPKRFTTALFWFLFGGIFLFGDLMVQELGKSLAYRIIGGGVIAIAKLRYSGASWPFLAWRHPGLVTLCGTTAPPRWMPVRSAS